MNSKRNIVCLVVVLLSSHMYLLHAVNSTKSVLSNVLRHVFVQNPQYFYPILQWPFHVDPAKRLFADYSKVHLVHCFHS
jgi:nicotinamide riboside transporter PnuC